MNKCDKAGDIYNLIPFGKTVMISALHQKNFDMLLSAIADCLPEKCTRVKMLIPFKNGSALNDIRNNGKIYKEEYTADGTKIDAVMPVSLAEKYKEYIK